MMNNEKVPEASKIGAHAMEVVEDGNLLCSVLVSVVL